MKVSKMGRAISIALLCGFYPIPSLSAQTETSVTDSIFVTHERAVKPVSDSPTSFRPTQLILPASLIAVGTFGVYNGFFRKMDVSIKEGMDNLRGNHYFHADDYVQYLPIAAYIGLDYIGVRGKHTLKERVVVGATAYIAMAACINTLKYTIREQRPDSYTRNSFPSGHTATAFTGAELVREEYGTWAGVGAYTVATGVAFLRLYNGRHWFNDLLAGAGIGILSARVGYWMLPLYRKWFGWSNGNMECMALMPSYGNRTLAINAVYVF